MEGGTRGPVGTSGHLRRLSVTDGWFDAASRQCTHAREREVIQARSADGMKSGRVDQQTMRETWNSTHPTLIRPFGLPENPQLLSSCLHIAYFRSVQLPVLGHTLAGNFC